MSGLRHFVTPHIKYGTRRSQNRTSVSRLVLTIGKRSAARVMGNPMPSLPEAKRGCKLRLKFKEEKRRPRLYPALYPHHFFFSSSIPSTAHLYHGIRDIIALRRYPPPNPAITLRRYTRGGERSPGFAIYNATEEIPR